VTGEGKHVGLLVTCLVDLMRPSVGFAAVKLLEAAGCLVSVPETQTCCGQPAYNAGDNASAAAIALDVIEAFEEFDYVVAPSGSCAAMVRRHFPALFPDDERAAARARALGERTFELTEFLADVMGGGNVSATVEGSVAIHDSCSALRELGIREQPRRLLEALGGIELREAEDSEVCCGFGGAFCVKYPQISDAMVSKKVRAISASGADMVVSTDLGCLLQIAGKLKRAGSRMQARHVAEMLAGMTGGPAIGEAAED
jgi:L-lactate dehydrogenase complex protein LldE